MIGARVVREVARSQELFADHVAVVSEGEHFRFLVQMVDG